MAFGKIDDRFWTDEKIRSYSDAGKLLAAYLLTSQHRTLIGAYRLPLEYICSDLQWSADKAAMALSEVCGGENPFIVRDPEGWIVIINFLKYEKYTSPNHFKAADFQLSRLPKSSPIFSIICEKLAAIWRDEWCRRPKFLEVASELPLSYLPVASKQPLTPAPAPAPAPEDIHNHKNGSGAEAPITPSLKSQLFGPCLAWMARVNGGADPKKYRSMIGQWISRYGESATLDAFMRAERGDPQGNPIAYVEAILRGSHGNGHHKSEQLQTGASIAASILADARARRARSGEGED